MWGRDYDGTVFGRCLDIYKDEVVEGYDDLPCSETMVKLYLQNNWFLYFSDKCEGDLCK